MLVFIQLISYSFLASARRFNIDTPDPSYPLLRGWPILANDLSSSSKTDKYGLAWERSGLFEGDIMMPPGDTRNTLLAPAKKWALPVPVYINSTDFDSYDLSAIEKSLIEIEEKTCVRFRQYQPTDASFIVVRGHTAGCWSLVGRRDGGQVIHLQRPQCVKHGIIIHEFLHALGMHHQQSSTERDNYIKINWRNIQQGKENNFMKYGSSVVTSYNLTYDYSSLMHYSGKAFSKNGEPTITPLDANAKIGQRKHMSELDVTKIRYLYNCPAELPVKEKPNEPNDSDNDDFDLDLEFDDLLDD